jgi:hypothetical protein
MRLSRTWIIVIIVVAVIVVAWIGASGVLTTGGSGT